MGRLTFGQAWKFRRPRLLCSVGVTHLSPAIPQTRRSGLDDMTIPSKTAQLRTGATLIVLVLLLRPAGLIDWPVLIGIIGSIVAYLGFVLIRF